MGHVETSRQARRLHNREAVQEYSLGFQPCSYQLSMDRRFLRQNLRVFLGMDSFVLIANDSCL